MKINRPTEDQPVKPFVNIDNGVCFELDGCLYIKSATGMLYANAMLLQECGCALECIPQDAQCILVDVEISYTYRRPEKAERND